MRLVTSYSEAAHFDGNHCHHVARKEEHERLERIKRDAQRAVRLNGTLRLRFG